MADRFADFNPRAPCGARRNLSAIGGGGQGFQSTRPAWGATLRLPVPRLPCRFQSTRPRGARPLPPLNLAHQHRPFQSTRPRGARLSFPNARCLSLQFQSTRPRGARLDTANIIGDIVRFQSTRPRGARRRNRLGMATVSLFQSTRPRGARHLIVPPNFSYSAFQSTRPAWGATSQDTGVQAHKHISIRAPLVGRDDARCPTCRGCTNFNPRAPRGARPRAAAKDKDLAAFQSTRPAWGATQYLFLQLQSVQISIHAPRVGRDAVHAVGIVRFCISIHAPRVGRDLLR